jgi:hypothetical protein
MMMRPTICPGSYYDRLDLLSRIQVPRGCSVAPVSKPGHAIWQTPVLRPELSNSSQGMLKLWIRADLVRYTNTTRLLFYSTSRKNVRWIRGR